MWAGRLIIGIRHRVGVASGTIRRPPPAPRLACRSSSQRPATWSTPGGTGSAGRRRRGQSAVRRGPSRQAAEEAEARRVAEAEAQRVAAQAAAQAQAAEEAEAQRVAEAQRAAAQAAAHTQAAEEAEARRVAAAGPRHWPAPRDTPGDQGLGPAPGAGLGGRCGA